MLPVVVVIWSLPAPASIVSAKVPPEIVSLPAPVVMSIFDVDKAPVKVKFSPRSRALASTVNTDEIGLVAPNA